MQPTIAAAERRFQKGLPACIFPFGARTSFSSLHHNSVLLLALGFDSDLQRRALELKGVIFLCCKAWLRGSFRNSLAEAQSSKIKSSGLWAAGNSTSGIHWIVPFPTCTTIYEGSRPKSRSPVWWLSPLMRHGKASKGAVGSGLFLLSRWRFYLLGNTENQRGGSTSKRE